MRFRLQMLYRAAFVMILALVSSSPAAAAGASSSYFGGIPWQTGDIVACSGAGTCSVLRIVTVNNVPTPMLLDQFSDGLLGNNTGVAINNTLHVVTTDDAGGGSSEVFVSPIASLNPNTSPASPVPHTPPVYTYDGSANNSSQVKAVAYNNAGNIFVLNSAGPGGSPEIVELGPGPGQTAGPTFSLSSCGISQATSMDLSADGNSAYVTSGGTIQKVAIPGGGCTKFADFGTGVTLYGIKDIPPGALPSTCGSTITNPSVSCPTDESLLVVAMGTTDPDATTGETGETGSPDPDAFNICTNVADHNPVSCALLLDTSTTPGLKAPLWQAANPYFTAGTKILDPSLHLQSVSTPGTSGAEEPTFNDSTTTGLTIDNAVKWTDLSPQPTWQANNAYPLGALPGPLTAAVTGTFFVDPNKNLETVTTAGTSGPVEPGVAPNPVNWSTSGSTTVDGLQWKDQGAWTANTSFTTLGGSPVGDVNGHVHEVLTGGTSGGSVPSWNDNNGTNGNLTAAGVTIDNAVEWTDIGQQTWSPSHSYPKGILPAPNVAAVSGTFFVDPNGNLQTVSTSGISGSAEPGTAGNPVMWNTSPGGMTVDGLQWKDQGAWQPSVLYANVGGSPVGDAAGHIHEVLTAGTSGASLPSWSDGGSPTVDNAVIWTNQGPVVSYSANHPYVLGTYTNPNGHIQQVVEPGTSGGSAPTFSTSGTRTIDNAVTWSDLGQAVWRPSFSYGLNAIVVDAGGHVQQVTTAGTSSSTAPSFIDGASPGGSVTDGLQWQNSGTVCGSSCPSPWTPGTQYPAGSVIDDATGFEWNAISGGTSGTSANRPAFETNETPSTILADNAVLWTDEGLLSGSAVFNWQANNAYVIDAEIVDPGNHVQVVSIAGTSGPAMPTFMDGGTVVDNAVTWADLGQAVWRPSFSYGLNAIIVDAGHHVQQVTTAGTTGAGPTPPSFPDDGTSSTADGSVVWTDRGSLAGFTWQSNNSYSQNAMIVDTTGDVQLATNAGQSGAGPNPPTFVDGANVLDGLVWMDIAPNTPWAASTSFALGTLTVDPGFFLQKVTTAGVSTTPNPPSWNDAANGTTIDGLQWSDQGMSVWTKSTLYPIGSLIADAATHVHKVYEAGTSGPGPNPPAFNDFGGFTPDNAVIWTESNPSRATNTAYSSGAIVLDTFSPRHVQQVTLAGTTGPSTAFTFSDTGQTKVDGLQWTDLGQHEWAASTQFFSQTTLISELTAPYHAQQVYEEGTSGTNTPTFNHALALTPDNAVVWTESSSPPTRAASTKYVQNAIVLDTANPPHVQQATQVTVTGITGPNGVTFSDSGSFVIDGLQWTNQSTPVTSVLARYPVTGATPTLQSLALDPLIADCTPTSPNSPCGYPLPPLQTSNFWLGDHDSGKIYKLDFAKGTPSPFDLDAARSAACGNNCSQIFVRGLGIYGSEGANQPGLAKILASTSNSSLNSETAFFPAQGAAGANSLNLTLYTNSLLAPSLGQFAMYASAVSPNSCYTDLPGNPLCLPTFPTNNQGTLPIVWKDDIPLPSSGQLALGNSVGNLQTLAGNFDFGANQSFSNDVALDDFYDTTTITGLDSPGFTKPSTVDR